MRTEIEVREDILNLRNELETIINAGETEQRELNEGETNRMAEIRKQIATLDTELEAIQKENEKIAENRNNNKNKENNKMKEIRLFDLIKGVVENNVTDEQRAYVNGNQINMRAAIQATVEDHGEENVPEDKKRLDVAIRNASVLDRLGVTWFGNAVGNIRLPKYSGSNVYWADSENADAADGAGTFSEVELSPMTSLLLSPRNLMKLYSVLKVVPPQIRRAFSMRTRSISSPVLPLHPSPLRMSLALKRLLRKRMEPTLSLSPTLR